MDKARRQSLLSSFGVTISPPSEERHTLLRQDVMSIAETYRAMSEDVRRLAMKPRTKARGRPISRSRSSGEKDRSHWKAPLSKKRAHSAGKARSGIRCYAGDSARAYLL